MSSRIRLMIRGKNVKTQTEFIGLELYAEDNETELKAKGITFRLFLGKKYCRSRNKKRNQGQTGFVAF